MTRGCLQSLRRLAGEVEFELVVVDNASGDGSSEMIETDFPEARLIRLPANRGFAAGVNEGIEASTARMIFVLNPDCLVPPGTLRRLRDFLDRNPTAAVAGAGLTSIDGRALPSTFSIPTLFREFWNFLPEIKSFLLERPWGGGLRRRLRAHGTEPRRVDAVSGAAFMARRTALDEVGRLDTGFFVYHEEIDLCARLRAAGHRIWSVPDAQAIHFDAQATGFEGNRLPASPVLDWRVLGMDRLWAKHRTPREHRRWRRLARTLLQTRSGLIGLSQPLRSATGRRTARARRRDLKRVAVELTQPAPVTPTITATTESR